MQHFILEMAKLYTKIKNGSASAAERARFEAEIELSCMNRNVLMDAIERAAEE